MEMSKHLSFCSLGDTHVDPSVVWFTYSYTKFKGAHLMCTFCPVHTFLFSFTAVKVSSGYFHSAALHTIKQPDPYKSFVLHWSYTVSYM